MARQTFIDDVTGAQSEAQGSDRRINVSSRADGRIYYNARDRGQAYNLTYFHDTAAAGEFSVYWKNTSTDQALVISHIGLNAELLSRVKLHFVSGTAAGGTAVVPVSTNSGKTADPQALCRQAAAGDAITGLGSLGEVDFAGILPGAHEEFRSEDSIRVAPGGAIALEYDTGVAGDFFGVIVAYYENAV